MQLVRYNHFFALLISMPHINSINFYQNRPKIVIFAKKNFVRGVSAPTPPVAEFLPPDSNCPRWLGDPPPDPRNAPPLFQIFGYRPA